MCIVKTMAILYLKRKWANLLWKLRDNYKKITGPLLPPPSLADQELLDLGGTKFPDLDSLLEHFQRSRSYFINRDQKADYVEQLNRLYPQAQQAILAQADRICRHIFDILGYKDIQLPPQIPWNTNFRQDKSPPHFDYYLNIDHCNLDEESDFRIPLELSRCHHWVTLGQAYWLSGEEKCAQEFVTQLEHWLETNPTDWGINWIISMEVAIRALNWIWAYYLFLDSPHFTPQIQLKLIKSLLLHARHIRENLEGHP